MALLRPSVLHGYFEETAKRLPHVTAIEWFEEKSTVRSKITYDQLRHDVTALSRFLCPFFGAESVGAIFMKRSSEKIYIAQLAVLKAGGAYTCLDTNFPDERINFILGDAKPSVIITDDHCKTRLQSCLKEKNISVVVYEDVKTCASNRKLSVETEFPEVSENQLAYVIYTSGTTGKPKGVLIEHRNICNLLLNHRLVFPEISVGWRIAQMSSGAYDSSVEEIFLAFATGGTLVVLDDETVRLGPDLSPWLQREHINMLTPPPTLLRSMGPEASLVLTSLKILYVGGEEMTPDLVRTWSHGRRLVNGYGPTECSVVVTVGELSPHRQVTIGKVLVNNTAHILDENLNPVEAGKSGELCISGLNVSRGYLNRPDLTAAKFLDHPTFGRIYRTGDLVSLNENGELLYFGRIDSQVKLRGYRIELSSIEEFLKKYVPEIKEAVCTVVKHGSVQKLVAFVILRFMDSILDVTAVKRCMSNQLPHYMVPSDIVAVHSFPTTTSGKLDTTSLKHMYMSQTSSCIEDVTDTSPSSGVEAIIARAFRSNLNLGKNPESTEDFFALGGDSLTAAMVISDLRGNPMTASLAVRDIYNQRTVGNLAKICSMKKPCKGAAQDKLPLQNCPMIITLLQLLWIAGVLYCSSLLAYSATSSIVNITLIAVLWLPVSVLAAACAKWTIIGRYTAGSHPAWGWFYLRHWIVMTVISTVPWKMISGTHFHNIVLRLLGAKVGTNVYIHASQVSEQGGWDLLDIGDNVVIGRDVTVATVKAERHHLTFGGVTIRDNVTLQTKSYVSCNTDIGSNSVITYSSLVASGSVIPAKSQVSGVPGMSSPLPPSDVKKPHCKVMSPSQYAVQLLIVDSLIRLLTSPIIISYQVDTYLDIKGFYNFTNDTTTLAAVKCGVLAGGVLISLIAQIVVMRVLGTVREGVYHRRTLEFMIVCLKDRIVSSAGLILSGTIFWPTWLRWAGMKIGKNCEISSIFEVNPELVTIEDETFFADVIYLGGPRFEGDYVVMERIKLSKGTFLGNGAIIPPGCHLPPDILIGVCSVADDKKIYPGSSWFGNPLFELPRREVVTAGRSVTHNPTLIRFISRLFWELLRFTITIPTVCVLVTWYRYLDEQSRIQDPTVFRYLTVPATTVAFLFFFPLLILILKWVLIGRMGEGIHPLWSCWCSRWDFLYVVWGAWAKPVLDLFNGTQLLNAILRLFGVSIGSNVFFFGAKFSQITDPDLLHFEDDTTVSCHFQAHTFEDRILKKAPLFLRQGATVAGGTVLMYGADVGRDAVVGEHSVVMKNEVIPPLTHFVGCPTRERDS